MKNYVLSTITASNTELPSSACEKYVLRKTKIRRQTVVKLNKFIFDVKQLKTKKFIFEVKQLKMTDL